MKIETELEKKLLSTVEFLWNLLDNIDTATDIAKGDDQLYRKIVNGEQNKRWQTGITSDGYKLIYDNLKTSDMKPAEIENLLLEYIYESDRRI